MRISYLLSGFGRTGGGFVLYRFMDELCRRGHEVHAVTPKQQVRWQPGVADEILRIRSSSRRPMQFARALVYRSPRLERLGLSIAARHKPEPLKHVKSMTEGLLRNWPESDITISTYCLTAFANFMLVDRTVPLYHMQHFEELFFPDVLSQRLARLTYHLPMGLVANSVWLQEQLVSHTGRSSTLLHPGMDSDVFYPRREVEEKYRGADRIRILSYSSAVPFKAWGDAVEAMRILAGRVDPRRFEWLVYGSAPGPSDVPLTYVGRVFGNDLAELYSSAHVVFMNSWYESFPLPPLEAMACGTAAVTTRIGTEDYAHNEDNSLVVPPRSAYLLAEAIVRLIDDPTLAASLASRGVETARRFSWTPATDRLERIISDEAAGHPSDTYTDISRLARGQLQDGNGPT